MSLSIQNVEVGLANLATHPVGLSGEPRQGIGVLRSPRPPLARAGAALVHRQQAAVTLKEVNNVVSRAGGGSCWPDQDTAERSRQGMCGWHQGEYQASLWLLPRHPC